MIWHDIRDPQDAELDRLAKLYNLHPLHIEDCRHRNQNAKLEQQNDYLFIVLKSVEVNEECVIDLGDLDFFIGQNYLITVQEKECPAVSEIIERAHRITENLRPDQLFHRIMDLLIDSYPPILDRFSDRIDEMEDQALADPEPVMLQQIFDMKRALLQFRRAMSNTREVAGHLLRSQFAVIRPDMMPFFRDVYDHLVRNLDSVEVFRDLLAGATELYLSSVANQTNQVMKVLTVCGTIATPAIVIGGIYGMNLKHLPFADRTHSFGIVIALMLGASLLMIAVMRRFRWL